MTEAQAAELLVAAAAIKAAVESMYPLLLSVRLVILTALWLASFMLGWRVLALLLSGSRVSLSR